MERLSKALGVCMCGKSEAGILLDPCAKEGVRASGRVGVTWFIKVSDKDEVPAISTT